MKIKTRHFDSIPSHQSSRAKGPLETMYEKMKVGDAYRYEGKAISSAANNARIWAKEKGNGWKFVQRKVDGEMWVIRTE